MTDIDKATFEDKVKAIMAQGHSRESAERIAGAMVRDGKSYSAKRAKIVKADSDRRLITAVTNVVTDQNGNKIVDHDGDVMDIDNLEDAFIDAFAKGGEGKSGLMHEQDGGADVAMFFTISKNEWDALKEGGYIGQEIGIVKIRVKDDSLWADVKSGKLPEVSIEGVGTREQI